MPGWWNGIHEGLKILWSHGLVGSSPAPGTVNKNQPKGWFFIYIDVHGTRRRSADWARAGPESGATVRQLEGESRPGHNKQKTAQRLFFVCTNASGTRIPTGRECLSAQWSKKYCRCTVIQNPPFGRILFEAWARVALAHKGFADLCLATWLPGHKKIKILLFPLSYLV